MSREAAASPLSGPAFGELTEDTLLRGRVRLVQPARGFRSSLDPVLLAGFLSPPYGAFLDVGCGTGAVSFLLIARDPAARGTGVEIQPRLAHCAGRGAEANGLAGQFTVIERDVRRARLPAAAFDVVVTNPPYRPLGSGVLPPDEERAVAHHEVHLRLEEWIAVATRVLKPDGRLGVVYAADRGPELLAGLLAYGLVPARVRAVHADAGAAATRLLVEARRGAARSTVWEPPLFVHEAGRYSVEVQRMLGEEP